MPVDEKVEDVFHIVFYRVCYCVEFFDFEVIRLRLIHEIQRLVYEK